MKGRQIKRRQNSKKQTNKQRSKKAKRNTKVVELAEQIEEL